MTSASSPHTPHRRRAVVEPHDLRVPSSSKLSLLPGRLQVPARQRFRSLRSALSGSLSPFGLYGSRDLIFVHIAKNAGSAVSGAVYPDFPPSMSIEANAHHTAQYLRRLDRDRFDRYASFAILRQPADRLRSAFNYLRFDSPFAADRAFARCQLADFADFGDFCDRLDADRMADLMRWPHFQPQVSYVCDTSGELMVDYLMTLDELELGLAQLADHLSLHFGPLSECSGRAEHHGKADEVVSAFYDDDLAIYEEVASTAESLYAVRPRRS